MDFENKSPELDEKETISDPITTINHTEALKINFPILQKQSGCDENVRIDPSDGTMYEWDSELQGFVPKINDSFMEQYQSNYNQLSTQETRDTKLGTKEESDVDILYQQYRKYFKDNYNVDMTDVQLADYFKSEAYQKYCLDVMESKLEESKKSVESVKENESKKEKEKIPVEKSDIAASKKKKKEWKDKTDVNFTVYVSNLPSDINIEGFKEMMVKYGLLFHDERDNKPKIKLYKNEDGSCKGDGVCTFAKVESVDLSCTILDGMRFKDNVIKCEEAKFEMKGDYDPKKKRRGLTTKEKLKASKRMKKLVEWNINDADTISEPLVNQNAHRVVVKNVFHLDDLTTQPLLKDAVKKNLLKYCEEFGTIKKVTLCENNPEGVVLLYMETPLEGLQCVESINGRIFMGRQIEALSWDGKTNYNIEESEESKQKRLDEWHKYIEGEDDTNKGKLKIFQKF